MLLDITRPLAPRTEPWPGDTPLTVERTASLGSGAGSNVCAVRMSTHLGTHVDAPWHLLPEGATVDALPLEAFVGPARVVDARGARGLVDASEALLRRLEGAERVLFRTRDEADPHRFDRGFAGLAPGLAEELARRGVRLVGTDAPSVDPWDARDLAAHRALARAGVPILEGLDLSRAGAGDHDLIALPLRLEGLDASPVRAVLRRPA